VGFWTNKLGQTQLNDGGTAAPELALLSGLCLRNSDGSDFDPATYAALKTWLTGANATNMAYKLSTQLSAMELNVEAGFVSGLDLVFLPGPGPCSGFMTIADLMAAADAALCADGYTPLGDPNRAEQECLKVALESANSDMSFVQAEPCPFTCTCVPSQPPGPPCECPCQTE
jgi:hypothetical protein